MPTLTRPRNDPAQYDDLADEWWRPRGAFCALHWLAEARAGVVPNASRPGAVLLDVACGGGLLAPHVAAKGYRHVGIDIGVAAPAVARAHGVTVVRGDALRLPIADESVDVVVAGEILEHVREPDRLVAEAARVLRPGGTFVCDSLADTRLCKFAMVTVGERLRLAPPGIHDPDLFVAPRAIADACRSRGIDLTVRGLRPHVWDGLAWLARRRDHVRMVPTRLTNVVWQGYGVKAPG